jgi:hypothetical protein
MTSEAPGRVRLPVGMPRRLHSWIRDAAAHEQVSMSEYACRILFEAYLKAALTAEARFLMPGDDDA